MKKAILLLCLSAGAALQAGAQWVKAGPEIGLNLTSLSSRYNGQKYDDGIRPGLKVGGVVDIGFAPWLSLQPGLYYSMKGSANVDRVVSTNGNTTVTAQYTQDYRINYLELPVNLLFKLGSPRRGQFFFGGGPYLALALSGKATNIETHTVTNNNGSGGLTDRNDYTLNIGNSKTDDVTPTDAGINLTAGFQGRSGLFFRGNLGLGFSNILPGGDNNNYMRNWGVGLSVGYLFW